MRYNLSHTSKHHCSAGIACRITPCIASISCHISHTSISCHIIPRCQILQITFFFFTHIYFLASGQAEVIGVVPSSPRFLPSIFIAHRGHQSHCLSIFHRVFLPHHLVLSASLFLHKEKCLRTHTGMHSGGFELTKLIYTRLEDNLIRHRGDRCTYHISHITFCFLPYRLPASHSAVVPNRGRNPN